MIVREATKTELPAVAKLVASVFSEDLKMITGKVVNDMLLLPYIKRLMPYIFVAEDQSAIRGAIVISERKLAFSPSLIWFYLRNFGFIISTRSYLRLITFRKEMPKKLDNEYFIEGIAVDESARNKGVGRELVTNAEKILKAKNGKYLGLVVRTENPAVEFYRAFGFIKVKDFATKAFGKWYYMRKAL